MKKTLSFSLLFLSIWSCAPEPQPQQEVTDINPLIETFDLPFGMPPFNEIKESHFLPATEAAISAHQAEIDQIAGNEAPPDFENTVLAIEKSGQLLHKISAVFSNLNSAHTNEEMQRIAKEIAPLTSAHWDNIRLNEKLFNRIKVVWDNRASENLGDEELMLLEKKYKDFVRNGALLADDQKARLRDINKELSLLSLQFGENVLAETNDYELVIKDSAGLSGLPDWLIERAAAKAAEENYDSAWVFTLQNPIVMPFLQYADNRELRKEIWTAYKNRASNGNENDNNELIKKLVALRAEKALMLGYENHAAYVLEENMAKNVERVNELLAKLWIPSLNAAGREAAELQQIIDESGESFELQPYDWRYYAGKLMSDKFNLSDEEVKPYFSVETVRNGIHMVCNKLWGLKFKELEGLPVYHEEVKVFEVTEADGTHLGVLMEDLYTRESKRGGAWMTSYRRQSYENGEREAPLIKIVCNFPPPGKTAPSLLTFDELTTYFHEFGHALHGLLSNVQFRSLAGTSVPRDFVELPSQALENWATAPEVLKQYARHYQTGDTIPDELIDKLKATATQGQGFATVEYLASALLDMDYHTRDNGFEGSAEEFEKNSMAKHGLIDAIIPRHRSTYFGHIFSGGYSAGYYSYIWSGVLDSDAFAAFEETGDLFDSGMAEKYRRYILSTGGSAEPMDLYVAFRGKEPEIDALLKKRGFNVQESIRK
jgi:peptidyl-dipeptidase Dcp